VLWDAFLTSYIFLRVVDQSKRIGDLERDNRDAASVSRALHSVDVNVYVRKIPTGEEA
jgi:hypothetical protein